jgi:hypothetical protein
LRPAVFELADIALDPGIASRVKTAASRVPGVLGLDKCFVRETEEELAAKGITPVK